jgi:hypothetical protein
MGFVVFDVEMHGFRHGRNIHKFYHWRKGAGFVCASAPV